MADLYVNINGTARRVKKMYIGVNGVARTVKLGYLGENNVAKHIWTKPNPVMRQLGYNEYSASGFDNIDDACFGMNRSYILFAGGDTIVYNDNGDVTSVTNKNTVKAYSASSFTESNVTSLGTARIVGTSGNVGNYVVFAGGGTVKKDGTTWAFTDGGIKAVDAYNNVLTRSAPSALTAASAPYFYSGQTSNYFLVAPEGNLVVNAYNTSLTRSTVSQRSTGNTEPTISGSMSKMNYVIFMGESLDYYNDSLTKNNLTKPNFHVASGVRYGIGNNSIIAVGGYTKSNNAYTDVKTVSIMNSSFSVSYKTLPEAQYFTRILRHGDYYIITNGKYHVDSSSTSAYVKKTYIVDQNYNIYTNQTYYQMPIPSTYVDIGGYKSLTFFGTPRTLDVISYDIS